MGGDLAPWNTTENIQSPGQKMMCASSVTMSGSMHLHFIATWVMATWSVFIKMD